MLVGCLQYGSGLRLHESLRLRIMDLDFVRCAIFVRNGKGGKDRIVTLADELIVHLRRHLEGVLTIFERDIATGLGQVYLPHALARKHPNADREWKRQYIFPASQRSVDRRSGVELNETWISVPLRNKWAIRTSVPLRFTPTFSSMEDWPYKAHWTASVLWIPPATKTSLQKNPPPPAIHGYAQNPAWH